MGIPKQSAGYSESFIHVDGNWTDTANDNDWCYGQGTWQEPYVIENVPIDASSSPTGSGIFINNSKNEFFIIRNCTVYNAGSGLYDGGIKLENTNNGTLTNNNCSLNNRYGIYLLNCININIKTNNATHNIDYGIKLSNVNNSQLINNNCSNTSVNDGIYLYDNCNNITVSGNTVNDNT